MLVARSMYWHSISDWERLSAPMASNTLIKLLLLLCGLGGRRWRRWLFHPADVDGGSRQQAPFQTHCSYFSRHTSVNEGFPCQSLCFGGIFYLFIYVLGFRPRGCTQGWYVQSAQNMFHHYMSDVLRDVACQARSRSRWAPGVPAWMG